ncbi:MAG: enoyl-CoA hydratase/isomerase family protein, partial [Rhodospirillales bacterium]|nr:enoyl-CoA hydratase/isomerase family protein [Rhodospirillales bacterium]
MTDDAVIATRVGRIGRLLLNRPKALNALDLPMIRALCAALAGWRDDPAVHAVVIDSASDRAFCAGGDIRAVRAHALAGEADEVERFFAEEYALNAMIAAFPKPYIALIDGICMGGGIGVSVHGQVRVATEHAVFAMPETAIGFFPDIGATYVLPRLPGALGLYLGLTGERMAGADAVHAGLATHFVPRERLPALRAAL